MPRVLWRIRCTQEAEQEEKNETKTVSSLVEDFAMVALQSDDGRVETELVRFLERFANRRAARTSVASFAGFRMNYRGINVARTSNAPPPYDLRRTIPFSDLAGFPSLHSGLENRISQPKSYFFNFNVSQKLFFYGLTTLFLLSNNSVVNKLIIIKSTNFTLKTPCAMKYVLLYTSVSFYALYSSVFVCKKVFYEKFNENSLTESLLRVLGVFAIPKTKKCIFDDSAHDVGA